jgi:hypothetical protein
MMACRCGRVVTVPAVDRSEKPAVSTAGRDAPHEADDDDDTIHTIKRMLRTRELPAPGKCPHSGKPANDVVVFRLHFDPVAEEDLAANAQATQKSRGLFGWFGGRGGTMIAAKSSRAVGHDVWVDMPVRVARESHTEILASRSQKQFRDMLRTVPIYAKLLAEHPTARIDPLPRHSDGQPTHARG